MRPSALSSIVRAVTPSDREERIRHLPAGARAAFDRYQADGDPATLDPVLFAILEEFIPDPPAREIAGWPGNTRLTEDLGFDSLAMAEVVFCVEDLFGISISDEEIIQVHSLQDLRGFIRRKLSIRTML